MKAIKSNLFNVENIELGGTTEQIVRGGRDKFSLLPKAFSKIQQVGVIGWGSQAPAHAQNMRDSFTGTDIKIKVGLRLNSQHWANAQDAGFTEGNGTLGEMFEVIRESDLVLLLIEDSAQVELHDKIFSAMKRGATLGLSHGFLLGYMESQNEDFPDYINVIGVCPKGMGPSVRVWYEHGKTINGAGINCSIAVEQDITGDATDLALGWGTSIGAPIMSMTTLRMERISDIFGERGILLGAPAGISRPLFQLFRESGSTEKMAFKGSVENITGPICHAISKFGIKGLYDKLLPDQARQFENAYSAAYNPFYWLMQEIYDEVQSGNEIRSVIMAGKRPKEYTLNEIDGTSMWKVGPSVRAERKSGFYDSINPMVAGIFLGAMMSQVDTLRGHKHCWTEVCNESIIEVVDSLYPFMHARGLGYMVDNCSVTARLGTRKWAPRFDYVMMQQIVPNLGNSRNDKQIVDSFINHPVHDALSVCATMRPPGDISVK